MTIIGLIIIIISFKEKVKVITSHKIKLIEILQTFLKLFKNLSLISIILAMTIENCINNSVMVFLPKIIENQFHKSVKKVI